MSGVIHLLVVEDDLGTIADWGRTVERHNSEDEKHGFRIELEVAESEEKAKALISSRRFDAAVIDLRLKSTRGAQGHNASGNVISALLAATSVAAISILTGQPSEAELPKDSPEIRVFAKGSGLGEIFDWLKTQSALILKMQSVLAALQKDMATIFHSSIWPRWAYWIENTDPDLVRDALTRHVISHLHAMLMNSTKGVSHPEEAYFVPVIATVPLSTGDLIRGRLNESSVEIVITPRCDLANAGKCKTIQLASCSDISELWKETKKKDSSEKKLSELRQHDRKTVQHFLPEMRISPTAAKGPWFVRFDEIHSLPLSDTNSTDLKTRRFATLTPDYLPSLVERLGAFFSRIGGPNFS